MKRIEETILKNLIFNDDYTRKVLPFISGEYFQNKSEKILFSHIVKFVNDYKNLPSYESLVIDLGNNREASADDLDETLTLLRDIKQNKDDTVDGSWLLEQTEKFCQDRAIYNAIMESVTILDDPKSKKSKGEIPKLLSDALSISFDNHIGHDYLADVEERYERYHRVDTKIPFDLEYFNLITNGGLSNKTLNIALAGTGVGKSLFMCHVAASCLMQGYNVLYITLEMSEDKIAERIDANLMNVFINNINKIAKKDYYSKIHGIATKTQGKLIIKEYPTASASVLNFNALINELKLKKNFVPHIIFVDYINICKSARLSYGANVNSYTYIKTIAEELRGMAVENNVPVVSATQTTRSGFTSSDPGLEDTSESFGLPATADLMFALISTEEMEKLAQMMVKQLKNRYSDLNRNKRFMIGVDKAKMRLYDTENKAQDNIVDSGQDNSSKFNGLKV
jgi:replicative DNA helicase